MNNDVAPPGLAQQSKVRTGARIVAVVLGLVGGVLLATGVADFAAMFDGSAPMGDGPGSILRIGAGGFCLVLALAAANAGWLRAQASYVAGETMPVVKDSIAYATAGPYCRQCGTRNDATAKFCDSCGQTLA